LARENDLAPTGNGLLKEAKTWQRRVKNAFRAFRGLVDFAAKTPLEFRKGYEGQQS